MKKLRWRSQTEAKKEATVRSICYKSKTTEQQTKWQNKWSVLTDMNSCQPAHKRDSGGTSVWECVCTSEWEGGYGAKERGLHTSWLFSPSVWLSFPVLPLRFLWVWSPLCQSVGVLVFGDGSVMDTFDPSILCLEFILETKTGVLLYKPQRVAGWQWQQTLTHTHSHFSIFSLNFFSANFQTQTISMNQKKPIRAWNILYLAQPAKSNHFAFVWAEMSL